MDKITMIMAIKAIGAGLIVVGVVVHLSRLPTRIGCKEVGAGHWGTHTHHLVEEFEGRTKMKWGHGPPPATVAPSPSKRCQPEGKRNRATEKEQLSALVRDRDDKVQFCCD